MRCHVTVVLEPDREEAHRYNVHVPALPGCRTSGESIEDALVNAQEAVAAHLESMLGDGEPVPVEANPTIATTVVVSPHAAYPSHTGLPDHRVACLKEVLLWR